MKIIITLILLIQSLSANSVEENLRSIASSVEVENGELVLKINSSVFYRSELDNNLSTVRLKVGQILILRKDFDYAMFYNRQFSLSLKKTEKLDGEYVLTERVDLGHDREQEHRYIRFVIHADKIVITSKEAVYTAKEILDKIEGNRKKLKADLASESVKDKFKNIASVVEIKEGDILLTIKVKNFRYIESVDGDSIFYPLELGQKIIIKKGFEHASFQSEHYALSLTKESNNQYILEELKSDKPSSDAITIKTLLKFKILDDKIELVTAKKTKDIEAASSNWLILLGIGVFIILGFILYLKRKIPNS